MKVITAKQLKNRTGEALKFVSKGEKLLVTVRGKPLAIILSAKEKNFKSIKLRPFNDAWKDIEESLRKTKPFFKNWKEAFNWSRKRM